MQNLPPLRMSVLSALLEIKERMIEDPKFLDGDDLPYDGDTLATLKKIMAPQIVTQTIEKIVGTVKNDRGRPNNDVLLSSEDQETVAKELKKLLEELNDMGTGEDLETNARIQITKTKASLVEQILKKQERAVNVKRMSEFMEVVVGILEDLVDEGGRELFLKRIEPYR